MSGGALFQRPDSRVPRRRVQQPEVARRALGVPSDAGELSQCVPPLHGALVGRLGKQSLGSLGHSLRVNDGSCSNMLAYLKTCRDKKIKKYIKP